MNYVVDASTVLAVILGEPGGDLEDKLMSDALISAVNLSEVVGKLVDGGMDLNDAAAACRRFKYGIVAFDEAQAFEAARLRPLTRRLGLSFADRACLALTGLRSLPVLTADRDWAKLDLGIDVRQIR